MHNLASIWRLLFLSIHLPRISFIQPLFSALLRASTAKWKESIVSVWLFMDKMGIDQRCYIISKNSNLAMVKTIDFGSRAWVGKRLEGLGQLCYFGQQIRSEADIIIFVHLMSIIESENLNTQSKKAGFHIAKFHYHINNTIPDLFTQNSNETPSQKPKILRTKKADRNMIFHYVTHTAEGVSTLDAESILESAKKLYISSECVRMSSTSFKKSKAYKVPYLPIYGDFHEILEFHLVDKADPRASKSSRIMRSKVKQVQEQAVTKQPIKQAQPNNFELYVIHHCHVGSKEGLDRMRWQNFIQKYHFVDENSGDEVKHKIYYSLILNYEAKDGGILQYFTPNHKLYEYFLGDYLVEDENGLQNVTKMQGYLLLSKDRVDKKLKELNDPSHQQSHKRWLKLPSEYYKQFMTLRKHTVSYYNSIHEQPKHSEHVLNNLICRYMHAMEYSYKASLESILEYLKWEKEISSKYNLTMFAQIHKLDVFSYLGQDYEGRSVILNRARNLKVDELKDEEEYCQYFIYYLEIWLQKKWTGYADQYTVIADVSGLGSSNFKLAVTKRNINDGVKYCPERQHKLIAVNVSSFAYFVWSFLQPLLPKRTVSKLSVVGTDRNEIIDVLTKQMDISVIPEYLGGKNSRIYSDDLQQQKEQLQLEKS